MMRKISVIIVVAIIMFFVGTYCYNKFHVDGEVDRDSVGYTDISWSYVLDQSPKLDSINYVKTISVPIRGRSSLGKKDCKRDNVKEEAQPVGDSAVSLPITQKVYSDSLYTAYVSGYEQSLDSIKIRSPTVTHTIIKTNVVNRSRKLNIGITGGYGYGIFSNRFEPFVGIGITYNILK